MISRTAVFVPVIVATAVSAVTVMWLATTRDPSREPPSPTAVSVPAPPAPPPPLYLRPVGDQYLEEWGPRLASDDGDGPPLLFLLSAAELDSVRHGWKLPRLAETMARELAAVLDEGCRGRTCTAEVEHARALLRTFIDDDESTRTFGAPRVRRWMTEDEVREEHRRIEITGRLAATTFDVTCTCTSWTVGMRMWNDIAECEATLRDHGRPVVRYAPVTLRGSGKEAVYFSLDAHDQIATLASGATLTIQSGYAYEAGPLMTSHEHGAPRGALWWTTEPAPR